MLENNIVLERPSFNCANAAFQDEGLLRVHAPFDARRTLCWHLPNQQGYWPLFAAAQISIGVPRSTSCWPATAVNPASPWSYTGTWAKAITSGMAFRNWATTTGTLTWTAPGDYAYVAIACHYGTVNIADVALALTPVAGSGAALLHATLDCHTAGSSPFQPQTHNLLRLGDQRFVTIATNIKAGDQITISRSVWGGFTGYYLYFYGLMAWNTTAGDPTVADDQHIGRNLLVASDPGLDGELLALRPVREDPGDMCYLPMRKDSPNALAAWGTAEHATATDTIAAAGGTGQPTIAITYFDDTNPLGVTWAPAVGERTSARAVRIATTGGVLMHGTLVGQAEIVQLITAGGWHEAWRIIFNGTLPTNLRLTGGYCGMFALAGGAAYALNPGTLLRTALALNDDSFSAASYGQRLFVAGGAFADAVLEFAPLPTQLLAGGQLKIQEQTGGDNKCYAFNPCSEAVPLTITANMIIGGGSRVSVWPRAALRTVVPDTVPLRLGLR